MNRRDIFKTFFASFFAKDAVAVVKAAPKPVSALDSLFFQHSAKMQSQILKVMRNQGSVSALLKKSTLPTGAGFSFTSVITQKSRSPVCGGWKDGEA